MGFINDIFGGGDDGAAEDAANAQESAATQARKREETRKRQIERGLAQITAMFEGNPIMKDVAKSYDWGTMKAPKAGATGDDLAVSGLPEGFTYVQVPVGGGGGVTTGTTAVGGGGGGATTGGGSNYLRTLYNKEGQKLTGDQLVKRKAHLAAQGITPEPFKSGTVAIKGAQTPQPGTPSGGGGKGDYTIQVDNTGGAGGGSSSSGRPGSAPVQGNVSGGGGGGGGTTWAIKGPDGKIYKQGEAIGWNAQEDTGGRTGGFDDAFYNKYRNSITDYYMPQVASEYGDAQDETLFRLARAGTTKSTAANDAFTELADQNVKQQEKVKSDADTAVAGLKSRVASEKQKAIDQLYATEDPGVAAGQATASVSNLSAESPTLSPLADIFNIATIGTAGGLQGYNNARYRSQIPGAQRSTSIVGG